MKISAVAHGIIVGAWLGLPCAQAAPAPINQPGFRVVVEMQDGSKLVGRGADPAFLFRSELMGEFSLSPEKIRTIECQPKTNVVKLITANGDTLSAQLTMKALRVETAFGNFALPVELIRRVSVSAWRNPAMQARPGLVAKWSGDGDAGDTLGENEGRLIHGVSFVPGKVGRAFDFNGTDSHIEVPDAPALRLTDELTIVFWAKRQQLDPQDVIIEKGGDWTGGQQNYEVTLNAAPDNYRLTFLFAGGWRGTSGFADFDWHHYAVVAREGDANPLFFIDGVSQPVQYRGGATNIRLYPSTRPLHLGAQFDPASGLNYPGKAVVDELALYNRALTPAEIQAICVEENNDELPPPPQLPSPRPPTRGPMPPTRPPNGNR